MARETEKEGILRKCPVCETPVDEAVALGLRDYQWVNDALPGRLGLMDFDGVLSQSATGRMLVLEFKPKGGLVSRGARLTFRTLVGQGFDVWVLWEQGKNKVKLGMCDDTGWPQKPKLMTQAEAAALARKWWDDGLR